MILSIKRAMDILDIFGKDGRQLGVTEVAKRSRMNKSTVSRVIATLEHCGYLTQSEETKKYYLGGKILALSAVILSNIDEKKVAAPYIRNLNSRINETVDLYIIDGHHRVGIERVESTHEVRTAFQIGNRAPLHAGAPGKVLLAFLPDDKREQLIDELELRQYTSHTITDKNILRQDLQKIREQGISISVEEYVSLFAGISVPIYDRTGAVKAALGVTGLASRFTPKKIKEYGGLAKETAAAISRELGYHT